MYRKKAEVLHKQYVETLVDEGTAEPVLQSDRDKEKNHRSGANLVRTTSKFIDNNIDREMMGLSSRGIRIA